MPDVTEVIAQHRPQMGAYVNGDLSCLCKGRFATAEDWAAHVAAELQLAQEWAIRSGVNIARAGISEENARDKADRYPESYEAISRFVTPWVAAAVSGANKTGAEGREEKP